MSPHRLASALAFAVVLALSPRRARASALGVSPQGALLCVEAHLSLLQFDTRLRKHPHKGEGVVLSAMASAPSVVEAAAQAADVAKAAADVARVAADAGPIPVPPKGKTHWQWAAVLAIPAILYASGAINLAAPIIIGFWMLASLSMNVANKQATGLFTATSLLVILQMLLAVLVILGMQARELSFRRWQDLAKWSVIPFFFAAMLTTSVLAFKETTMSTILILRNMLPLVAFVAEKTLMDAPKNVTLPLVLSMLLTLVGTVLYGYTNASVTYRGAILIGINCAVTVVDRLLQRYFLSDPDFSVSLPLCMVVNNTLGILPMLAFAAFTGEFSTWGVVVREATEDTWFWVVISGLVGCCLGYTGLRCQKIVSATTFLMLQNFNKIAVIFVDVAVMQSSIVGMSLLGCSVSLAGSFWYGAEQVKARNAEEAARLEPPRTSAVEEEVLFGKKTSREKRSSSRGPAEEADWLGAQDEEAGSEGSTRASEAS